MNEIEKFYQYMPKREFEYHIHISEQNSYIYFETPKVACTTVKSILQDLEDLTQGKNPLKKEHSIIHNKKISPLLSPSDIGIEKFSAMLNDDKVFKFCFVRNPYTRVLSAFLNKINQHNGLQNKKISEILKLSGNTKITFLQFLEAVKTQSSVEMDPHWRPQTNQLFYGLVNYHFIGRFENFNDDLEKVINEISLHCHNKHKKDIFNNLTYQRRGDKTHANSKYNDFYSDNLRNLAFSIYEQDFQCFGYSKDFFINKKEDENHIIDITNHILTTTEKLKTEVHIIEEIQKYKEILLANPNQLFALKHLAKIYEELKKYDLAIFFYKRIVQLEPANSSVYLQLAHLMKIQGNFQEAVTYYHQTIKHTSEQPPWVYVGLGVSLGKINCLEESIAAYRKAIELSSQQPPWVYVDCAKKLILQSNLEEAGDLLTNGIKEISESAKVYLLYVELAECYKLLSKNDLALNLLKKAKEKFSQDDAQLFIEQKIGDVLFEKKKSKQNIFLTKNDNNPCQSQAKELIDTIISDLQSLGITQVIIWGLKSPKSHTHYWIHSAFYRAFQYIFAVSEAQIGLHWLDYQSQICESDLKNSLILTACNMYESGNELYPAHKNLPIVDNAFYLVHRSGQEDARKFYPLADEGRCIFFDEFRDHGEHNLFKSHSNKYDVYRRSNNTDIDLDYHNLQGQKYQYQSINFRKIILLWATDILPYEINFNRDKIREIINTRKERKDISFIGSIWHLNYDYIIDLIQSISSLDLHFNQRGRFVCKEFLEDERLRELDEFYSLDFRSATTQENIEMVQKSFMSPAIQGKSHIGIYIPCRIFKNISYGAMGVTNNYVVNDLFDGKVVFDENIHKMMEKAVMICRKPDLDQITELMDFVRDNHTYINRTSDMIGLLKLVNQ